MALGQGRIITGMDRGLVGTCLYERRRITLPPNLGYGERGVGELIPSNSTLVFYIRLIKLERVSLKQAFYIIMLRSQNGEVLGNTVLDLKDVWEQGLYYYSNDNHHKAVEMFEKSLKMFNHYQTKSHYCLSSCNNSSKILH